MSKKKDTRFVTVEKYGSQLSDEGVKYVMVDRETGVNYLFVKSGYGAGLTPLLDRDGKPVISRLEDLAEL